MSNTIVTPIAGNGNPLDPDFDTYREIVALIPEMQVSATSNPRRLVTAEGWRFAADKSPLGAFVFGQSPTGNIYLVDGVAALHVVQLLAKRPRWLHTDDGNGLRYCRLENGQVVAVCDQHYREHREDLIFSRPSPGHSRNGDLSVCSFCNGVGT